MVPIFSPAPHNPRNCRLCAPFRHPSQAGTGLQVTALLPRQIPAGPTAPEQQDRRAA
jgi:hypothetical protein